MSWRTGLIRGGRRRSADVITSADRRLPPRIKPVRQDIQLLHKTPDLLFVEFLEIPGPVVLVTESPKDHRRVVVMLTDHIRQHPPGLLPVLRTAKPAPAPGYFFPYENAKTVA